MDPIKRLSVSILLFVSTVVSSSQTVKKQFQETKYDIKDCCMMSQTTGWAVGKAHWNQANRAFESTLLKTTTGGEDWAAVYGGLHVDLWGVHFLDAERGWVVGDSGSILFTNDGGENWLRQNANTSINFKSVFFADESNGWAVANEPIHFNPFQEPDAWKGRIWHTGDGGVTWEEQRFPPDVGFIHRIFFLDDRQGWAVGVKNHQIDFLADTYCVACFTEDGGQTWTERFSPEIDLVFTDIHFIGEEHGWITGFAGSSAETGGTLFRTCDGGENWERISENHVLWKVAFVDNLRGFAVGADYISAWGPPVLRTMDGGINWQKIHMVEHASNGFYGLGVFDDKVIALGDQGYQTISLDPWGEMGHYHGEQLFTQKLINVLYEFEDIFFINRHQGWVVGRKSISPDKWAQVILYTDDGGEHWVEQYAFSGEWMSHALRFDAVQFVSETRGWVSGHSVTIGSNKTTGVLFTDDGGQSWNQQAQGVSKGEIVDLFFLDEQIGWALSGENAFPDLSVQILKTTDGGNTWELINTGQPGLITIGYAIRSGKIFFQDMNTGWILGAQGTLLNTLDGGIHWSTVSLPMEYINTYSIAFNGTHLGYIAGEVNFRTLDGGMTWTADRLSDRTMTDLCFVDSSQGWMAGEWGEIYKTEDGGLTWQLIPHSATSAAMKSVTFIGEKYGWAAGRGGTVVQIDNDKPSGIIHDPSGKAPQSFRLSQNHPNPFNASTIIRYDLPVAAFVSLRIFDLAGREVRVLVNKKQPAGSYNIHFDASPLASGIYFYLLQTDSFHEVRKMTAIK